MKKIINISIVSLLVLSIVSCDPIENRDGLPSSIKKEDLQYSVTQDATNPNIINLSSSTPRAIPFWDYVVGTSNKASTTVFIPFEGDYWIKYYAYAGGVPAADSVKLTLTQNTDYFSDPAWDILTHSTEGRTWVLNMEHPLGYYGLDYGTTGPDNWSWEPDLATNTWIMENKDWGEMTFDLNRGYNYSRTMYDDDGKPVTCKGTFNMDLETRKVLLNGCELLYGGTNFYSVVSNWKSTKIIRISDEELVLGVVRDQSTEGVCYLGFRFKPKE